MAEKKDILDDENEDTEALFQTRKSVPLTPENARFFRSAGGLISLELTAGEKTADTNAGADANKSEVFERVVVMRSFPVSNPDEFLSVREPDTKKSGRGKEIGMIRHISEFDAETAALLEEELSRRYFTPGIIKINSVKDKFGYSYWDAETTAGNVTFVLNSPFTNIRVLEDNRITINDMDGNCFRIDDTSKLDPFSFKKIDMYL